jgi:hypothetical protein
LLGGMAVTHDVKPDDAKLCNRELCDLSARPAVQGADSTKVAVKRHISLS